VTATGSPGDVRVPEGVDFRNEVAALVPPQANRSATVCARTGAGLALRRRASATTPGEDGWDELTVPYIDADVLAEEVTGFGPDVRVLAPDEVRDAVVRRLRAVLAVTGGTDRAAAAPDPAGAAR